MPYIKQDRRTVFEQAIEEIIINLGFVGPDLEGRGSYDDNAAKGELNYIIFTIIKRYLEKHGMRYARAQDMIGGVLSCCQMECYRVLLGPYEVEAEKKNGAIK